MMILAKVTGRIEATQKCDEIRGCNILLITAVGDDDLLISNRTYAAVDRVGAGRSDIVLVDEHFSFDGSTYRVMSIIAIVEKVHRDC